ncbi:MAG: DUF2959 domain-containing protein [Gammaproteobacteria bacterium]
MRNNSKKLSDIGIRILVPGLCAGVMYGCAGTYYSAMEKMGVHKRDILVDRVEEARDAQQEGKQQFKSALEQFNKVLGFKGGDIRDKYNKLNDEYEASVDAAAEVRERIEKVESVSEALFEEWQDKLGQYSDTNLRRSSERQLKATKEKYIRLVNAMKKAEGKLTPVLNAFRDQVLFLKHNLNARAISSLHSELGKIENDIAKLVREMERSINEANHFISDMARNED